MDKRLSSLQSWLENDLGLKVDTLTPASADASFRRYFRAATDKGIFVIMDAPPEKERIDNFIRIDEALIKQSVHAPLIIHKNIASGFILLEDLGSTTLLDKLNSTDNKHVSREADELYSSAINSLIDLQKGYVEQPGFDLPNYTQALLAQEMQLLDDWYFDKHLKVKLNTAQQSVLEAAKRYLIQACLEQPQTWVHRDYHSRNLMVLADNQLGVIDFQDMVIGPITYDLASIFKDCYIEWPREKQCQWLGSYYRQAKQTLPNMDFTLDQLIKWYDLTGLQRHIKVLGIFCRLNYRDNKPHYLSDLPLVKKYLMQTCGLYNELSELQQLFQSIE